MHGVNFIIEVLLSFLHVHAPTSFPCLIFISELVLARPQAAADAAVEDAAAEAEEADEVADEAQPDPLASWMDEDMDFKLLPVPRLQRKAEPQAVAPEPPLPAPAPKAKAKARATQIDPSHYIATSPRAYVTVLCRSLCLHPLGHSTLLNLLGPAF